ncbi:alpha/beta hydrolase [Nocardia sp. NPDC055321]
MALHGRASRQSAVGARLAEALIKPVLQRISLSPRSLRAAGSIDSIAGFTRATPADITCEPVQLAGFGAEIVRPRQGETSLRHGAILYFHGGAFVLGGLNTHRPVVAALARRTGRPVVHLVYRQLPHVPITGSIDDGVTAYRWLLDQVGSHERVVFAGDSAGGFLVFATAIRARDAGLPTPAALIGISPWLDLDCASKLAHPNSYTDSYLPANLLDKVSKLGAPHRRDHSLSPVDADLTELPPALLLASTTEVLRLDAELMHSRLNAAGTPCALHLWEGQVHAFPALFPTMPESRLALDECAAFARTHLSNSGFHDPRSA